MIDDRLKNYRILLDRVDTLCRDIGSTLQGRLTCSAGCSSCCIPISLFPVEAYALRIALHNLPDVERHTVVSHVQQLHERSRCPLLKDDRCLLYHARPIICRTHGLPILYQDGQQRRVDYCPRNDFSGMTLSGSQIVDVETLNSLLVAVNALFIDQAGDGTDYPERLELVDALLGDITS